MNNILFKKQLQIKTILSLIFPSYCFLLTPSGQVGNSVLSGFQVAQVVGAQIFGDVLHRVIREWRHWRTPKQVLGWRVGWKVEGEPGVPKFLLKFKNFKSNWRLLKNKLKVLRFNNSLNSKKKSILLKLFYKVLTFQTRNF